MKMRRSQDHKPANPKSIRYAESLARKLKVHRDYDWSDIQTNWSDDEVKYLIDYLKYTAKKNSPNE